MRLLAAYSNASMANWPSYIGSTTNTWYQLGYSPFMFALRGGTAAYVPTVSADGLLMRSISNYLVFSPRYLCQQLGTSESLTIGYKLTFSPTLASGLTGNPFYSYLNGTYTPVGALSTLYTAADSGRNCFIEVNIKKITSAIQVTWYVNGVQYTTYNVSTTDTDIRNFCTYIFSSNDSWGQSVSLGNIYIAAIETTDTTNVLGKWSANDMTSVSSNFTLPMTNADGNLASVKTASNIITVTNPNAIPIDQVALTFDGMKNYNIDRLKTVGVSGSNTRTLTTQRIPYALSVPATLGADASAFASTINNVAGNYPAGSTIFDNVSGTATLTLTAEEAPV